MDPLAPAVEDDPSAVAPTTLPRVTPLVVPDAPPAQAHGDLPVLVPDIGELRFVPTEPSSCGGHEATPVQSAPTAQAALLPRLGETHGGLDKTAVELPSDTIQLGAAVLEKPAVISPTLLLLDSDGDCLPDVEELRLGTDPHNPDTDGDGWYDGPCNERRKLVLTQVHCTEEQDFWGGDEFYVIADDTRYPTGDLDGTWNIDEGQTIYPNRVIATRTRGINMPKLALVNVEGWEDDFEIIPDWTADDLLFTTQIDLGAYKNGDLITRHFVGPGGDYDYTVTFRVDVEHFADPNPKRADGDADHDGITELHEAQVARDFGGVTDPTRPDVLVEVDWMPGHELRTNAKREVVTQYANNGLHLFVLRDHQLTLDPCLTVPEARTLYATQFGTKKYGAFRYAVIGEQIWNDRSGVNWGDIVLIDDSTWWINNWILPQAGTFIHEMGHTLGLNQEMFRLIDTVGWPSYDSAMNYFWQATKVDYSHDGAGGSTNDHDDWGAIDAGYALQYSFGLTTSTDVGICK
jgi:hypothetical protein